MALLMVACCFAGPGDLEVPRPMAVEELIQMESRDATATLGASQAGSPCVGWEVWILPAILIVGVAVAIVLLV